MGYGMTDDFVEWRDRALAAEKKLADLERAAKQVYHVEIVGPDTTRFHRAHHNCTTISRLLSQLGVKYEDRDEIEFSARVVSRVVMHRRKV